MINLSNNVTFKEHRCGWQYALDALKPLHTDDGVILDGFIERSHSWDLQSHFDNGTVPYTKPWIGFFHNPPHGPDWFDGCSSPQVILDREVTKASLKHCVGLFTLSDYLRHIVHRFLCRSRDDHLCRLPVESLVHPTDLDVPQFTMRKWMTNRKKKVIAIGYWMRKMHSIKKLPVNHEKIWLVPSDYASDMRHVEAKTMDTFDIIKGDYKEYKWVPHENYDNLLSRNIAFVDLYDVSACNSILECIARNTPVLTNRHEATVEYLGPDYPLYFDSLNEAAAKANSDTAIGEAYEYLRGMSKKKFTQKSFLESFKFSEIASKLTD